MQLGRYSVCHWGGTQHATWADPNEAVRTGGLIGEALSMQIGEALSMQRGPIQKRPCAPAA